LNMLYTYTVSFLLPLRILKKMLELNCSSYYSLDCTLRFQITDGVLSTVGRKLGHILLMDSNMNYIATWHTSFIHT
jgi:hypothetical protein